MIHWYFHATRHWTTGQVVVTLLAIETVVILAAWPAWSRLRHLLARRRHPARTCDIDGRQRRHAHRYDRP